MYPIFHLVINFLVQGIPTIIGTVSGASIAPIAIYFWARNRENYQHLLDRKNQYNSVDMMIAVKSLRDLYDEYGSPKFVEQYIKIKIDDENA